MYRAIDAGVGARSIRERESKRESERERKKGERDRVRECKRHWWGIGHPLYRQGSRGARPERDRARKSERARGT